MARWIWIISIVVLILIVAALLYFWMPLNKEGFQTMATSVPIISGTQTANTYTIFDPTAAYVQSQIAQIEYRQQALKIVSNDTALIRDEFLNQLEASYYWQNQGTGYSGGYWRYNNWLKIPTYPQETIEPKRTALTHLYSAYYLYASEYLKNCGARIDLFTTKTTYDPERPAYLCLKSGLWGGSDKNVTSPLGATKGSVTYTYLSNFITFYTDRVYKYYSKASDAFKNHPIGFILSGGEFPQFNVTDTNLLLANTGNCHTVDDNPILFNNVSLPAGILCAYDIKIDTFTRNDNRCDMIAHSDDAYTTDCNGIASSYYFVYRTQNSPITTECSYQASVQPYVDKTSPREIFSTPNWTPTTKIDSPNSNKLVTDYTTNKNSMFKTINIVGTMTPQNFNEVSASVTYAMYFNFSDSNMTSQQIRIGTYGDNLGQLVMSPFCKGVDEFLITLTNAQDTISIQKWSQNINLAYCNTLLSAWQDTERTRPASTLSADMLKYLPFHTSDYIAKWAAARLNRISTFFQDACVTKSGKSVTPTDPRICTKYTGLPTSTVIKDSNNQYFMKTLFTRTFKEHYTRPFLDLLSVPPTSPMVYQTNTAYSMKFNTTTFTKESTQTQDATGATINVPTYMTVFNVSPRIEFLKSLNAPVTVTHQSNNNWYFRGLIKSYNFDTGALTLNGIADPLPDFIKSGLQTSNEIYNITMTDSSNLQTPPLNSSPESAKSVSKILSIDANSNFTLSFLPDPGIFKTNLPVTITSTTNPTLLINATVVSNSNETYTFKTTAAVIGTLSSANDVYTVTLKATGSYSRTYLTSYEKKRILNKIAQYYYVYTPSNPIMTNILDVFQIGDTIFDVRFQEIKGNPAVADTIKEEITKLRNEYNTYTAYNTITDEEIATLDKNYTTKLAALNTSLEEAIVKTNTNCGTSARYIRIEPLVTSNTCMQISQIQVINSYGINVVKYLSPTVYSTKLYSYEDSTNYIVIKESTKFINMGTTSRITPAPGNNMTIPLLSPAPGATSATYPFGMILTFTSQTTENVKFTAKIVSYSTSTSTLTIGESTLTTTLEYASYLITVTSEYNTAFKGAVFNNTQTQMARKFALTDGVYVPRYPPFIYESDSNQGALTTTTDTTGTVAYGYYTETSRIDTNTNTVITNTYGDPVLDDTTKSQIIVYRPSGDAMPTTTNPKQHIKPMDFIEFDLGSSDSIVAVRIIGVKDGVAQIYNVELRNDNNLRVMYIQSSKDVTGTAVTSLEDYSNAQYVSCLSSTDNKVTCPNSVVSRYKVARFYATLTPPTAAPENMDDIITFNGYSYGIDSTLTFDPKYNAGFVVDTESPNGNTNYVPTIVFSKNSLSTSDTFTNLETKWNDPATIKAILNDYRRYIGTPQFNQFNGISALAGQYVTENLYYPTRVKATVYNNNNAINPNDKRNSCGIWWIESVYTADGHTLVEERERWGNFTYILNNGNYQANDMILDFLNSGIYPRLDAYLNPTDILPNKPFVEDSSFAFDIDPLLPIEDTLDNGNDLCPAKNCSDPDVIHQIVNKYNTTSSTKNKILKITKASTPTRNSCEYEAYMEPPFDNTSNPVYVAFDINLKQETCTYEYVGTIKSPTATRIQDNTPYLSKIYTYAYEYMRPYTKAFTGVLDDLSKTATVIKDTTRSALTTYTKDTAGAYGQIKTLSDCPNKCSDANVKYEFTKAWKKANRGSRQLNKILGAGTVSDYECDFLISTSDPGTDTTKNAATSVVRTMFKKAWDTECYFTVNPVNTAPYVSGFKDMTVLVTPAQIETMTKALQEASEPSIQIPNITPTTDPGTTTAWSSYITVGTATSTALPTASSITLTVINSSSQPNSQFATLLPIGRGVKITDKNNNTAVATGTITSFSTTNLQLVIAISGTPSLKNASTIYSIQVAPPPYTADTITATPNVDYIVCSSDYAKRQTGQTTLTQDTFSTCKSATTTYTFSKDTNNETLVTGTTIPTSQNLQVPSTFPSTIAGYTIFALKPVVPAATPPQYDVKVINNDKQDFGETYKRMKFYNETGTTNLSVSNIQPATHPSPFSFINLTLNQESVSATTIISLVSTFRTYWQTMYDKAGDLQPKKLVGNATAWALDVSTDTVYIQASAADFGIYGALDIRAYYAAQWYAVVFRKTDSGVFVYSAQTYTRTPTAITTIPTDTSFVEDANYKIKSPVDSFNTNKSYRMFRFKNTGPTPIQITRFLLYKGVTAGTPTKVNLNYANIKVSGIYPPQYKLYRSTDNCDSNNYNPKEPDIDSGTGAQMSYGICKINSATADAQKYTIDPTVEPCGIGFDLTGSNECAANAIFSDVVAPQTTGNKFTKRLRLKPQQEMTLILDSVSQIDGFSFVTGSPNYLPRLWTLEGSIDEVTWYTCHAQTGTAADIYTQNTKMLNGRKSFFQPYIFPFDPTITPSYIPVDQSSFYMNSTADIEPFINPVPAPLKRRAPTTQDQPYLESSYALPLNTTIQQLQLQNSGPTYEAVTSRIRNLRFRTLETHDKESKFVNMSSFRFYTDYGAVLPTKLSNPMGSRRNPKDGPNAVLGDTNSRWVDYNKLPLLMSIEQHDQPIVTFQFSVPNAADGLSATPVRWILEGSYDGRIWEILHEMSDDSATFQYGLSQRYRLKKEL